MKIVYTEYFQKSKVFLYPLLGIKKGISHVPSETYVCWDGLYSEKDYKFICVYNCDKDDKYLKFELNNLLGHPMLDGCYVLSNDKFAYVFDFSEYKHDHQKFINGQYSKFSLQSKEKIINFFNAGGKMSKYIESFLNPDEYHQDYADSLGVNVEQIKEVHEVCSKPDMLKETLSDQVPNELELLNSLKTDK